MLKKISICIFVLIIFSSVLIAAQDEKTFTVTESENTAHPDIVNQNSPGKIVAQSVYQVKVSFITNPIYSDLVIDNVNYGTTPQTVYLFPGTHQIRISKSGYFTANFNIFIKSGFDYTYTVRMYPGTGNPIPFISDLRIANSFPRGLNVSFIADVTSGSGEYSYLWKFGDGSTQLTLDNVVFHTYSQTGKYTATVIVTDLDTGLSSKSFRTFTLKNNTIKMELLLYPPSQQILI